MATISNKNSEKNNDDSDLHNDEIGENTGDDTLIAKAAKLKPGEDVKTKQASSNKEQGPAGENL
jgi:hypothetical protein